MPEFFEADDVVKDFDSTIVARIFKYVKPYKALLVWSVLALVLSTLGELLLPVLVQRTIDDSLVVSWSALQRSAADDPRLDGILRHQDVREARDSLFVRRVRLSSLSSDVSAALEAEGLIDFGPYYLTPWSDPATLPDRKSVV